MCVGGKSSKASGGGPEALRFMLTLIPAATVVCVAAGREISFGRLCAAAASRGHVAAAGVAAAATVATALQQRCLQQRSLQQRCLQQRCLWQRDGSSHCRNRTWLRSHSSGRLRKSGRGRRVGAAQLGAAQLGASQPHGFAATVAAMREQAAALLAALDDSHDRSRGFAAAALWWPQALSQPQAVSQPQPPP